MAVKGNERKELNAWIDSSFPDRAKDRVARASTRRVLAWTDQHRQMASLRGDLLSFAFDYLPPSAGWLSVSVLERAVILRFDHLKGYPPFEGAARSGLLKKLRPEAFLDERTGHVTAKVDLEKLAKLLEWKDLAWRLDQIAELAENAEIIAAAGLNC